jgi:hypothetical protein
LLGQSVLDRQPWTHWTPWQISLERQSLSARQISWQTFLMHSSFDKQFESVLQMGLQSFASHCEKKIF